MPPRRGLLSGAAESSCVPASYCGFFFSGTTRGSGLYGLAVAVRFFSFFAGEKAFAASFDGLGEIGRAREAWLKERGWCATRFIFFELM